MIFFGFWGWRGLKYSSLVLPGINIHEGGGWSLGKKHCQGGGRNRDKGAMFCCPCGCKNISYMLRNVMIDLFVYIDNFSKGRFFGPREIASELAGFFVALIWVFELNIFLKMFLFIHIFLEWSERKGQHL